MVKEKEPTDDDYKKAFKMPKVMKIIGRSSTLTNSFVAAIMPVINPRPEEIREVLNTLEIDPRKLECAYCGKQTDTWDHFKPLVINKRPSGYITAISNLIPSCGKCNMSKRNVDWKEWMLGDAPLSPKSKKISDLDKRIQRIEKLERWANNKRIEVERIVGSNKMAEYINHLNTINEEMRIAQDLAEELKQDIAEHLKEDKI